MADSLGIFNFISLEAMDRGGVPLVPQLVSSTVQRPGVSGTGIITQGSKARSFQMRSSRDVGSISLGNALAVSYQVTARTEAWILVFQGINYATTYNTKYFVLNVDQISVRRLTGSAGGVMGGGAGALVSAVWTLQPVAVPPEEEEE